MRVLLVNSPLGRPQPPVFPLGLAYVAGALKNHEVVCFDAAVAQAPFRDLAEIADHSNPELIGLSLRNIDTLTSSDIYSYWPSFVATVRLLRGRCPDAVMVVGGAGFSLFAEAVMEQLPEVDFGVYLEGEATVPELLDHLDQPEAVKGIYYRRDGRVMFSGTRAALDLQSMPMPRRDILDIAMYEGAYGMGVQTKRGCAYDCLYCTYPFLTGRKVRLRSPESVGEELETLSREFGQDRVFFADNVFNWPLGHAEAICREILRRKLDIQWTAYFSEKTISSDFVSLALESGCTKFTFAPDGSNDAVLGKLGKEVTRSQLESTYRVLEGFPGAKFACSFVWNYPQTGWQDLCDLVSLVFQLVRMKNLAGLGFTAMRILPNTRLHEIALREGYISPQDDLLNPRYYDPVPWNSITVLVRLLRKLRRIGSMMTRTHLPGRCAG